MKGEEIVFKLEIILLNSLYKIPIEKSTTKFVQIVKFHEIYYRISYTKNQHFANLMKIHEKYDISSL